MASNNFDQVSAEALLKQMYDITQLNNLSYSDRPFFGLVPKKGQVGGTGEKIPLMTSTSQGFAHYSFELFVMYHDQVSTQ